MHGIILKTIHTTIHKLQTQTPVFTVAGFRQGGQGSSSEPAGQTAVPAPWKQSHSKGPAGLASSRFSSWALGQVTHPL